jgi:hypothetical protein
MATEPMMRTTLVCAAILASCLATSISAQKVAAGEIVVVGRSTYTLWVADDRIAVADKQAMKRASEYCARLNQTMGVKGKLFDMGFGYLPHLQLRTAAAQPSDH